MNRAMADQSGNRILVVDHSKFGHVAACLVCPVKKVDVIITDTGASNEVIAPFLALGIEVLRV